MGMYTQLAIGVRFKHDVPEEVIQQLKYMTGRSSKEVPHPGLFNDAAQDFFACNRWNMVLSCDSYYFDWETRFHFDCDELYPDKPIWCLTGTSNLKNYDGEIAKFLLWIAPFLQTGEHGREFLGFTRYEEDDHPTLIYNDRGTITFDRQDGGAKWYEMGWRAGENHLIKQLPSHIKIEKGDPHA